MKTYFASYLAAMLISLFLTPIVARLARRWGVLDTPDARKIHKSPTPRLGGVAIFIAMFCAVLPAMALQNLVGVMFRMSEPRVVAMLIASVAVFLTGLADDIWGLPSKFKLFVISAAALAVGLSGTQITAIHLGPWGTFPLGSLSLPITIGWIVAITVAINFIDGLDGLAAGIAAIAAGVIAAMAVSYGSMVTAVIALALLGGLTGFLRHNFHPAKIFMGDCGSMFVGFLLASSAVMCADKKQTFLALIVPAIALGIPIVDTCMTMVRRGILQRRPLFAAERGHIHHRLMDMGLKHREAVLVLYGVTLVAAASGMAMFFSRRSSFFLMACLWLLPLALFWLTGVMRVRQIFGAVKRNLLMGRSTAECKSAFAAMQLKVRTSHSFRTWWQNMSEAADALGLHRVCLSLETREGGSNTLLWCRENSDLQPDQTVSTTLPLRQRRSGAAAKCVVETTCRDSIELASLRVMLFSRLIDECSLAQLPMQLRGQREADDVPASAMANLIAPALGGAVQPLGLKGLPWWLTTTRSSSKSTKAAPARVVQSDQTDEPKRRVAVVHDFLYVYAGAERVLEQILAVYPDADVFSLFDFLPESQRGFLQGKKVTTSFLQKMPLVRSKHRAYLPLMPLAIEQLDLSSYDLVISSSYLAAKGILTRADQLHVCYCHTPVRFAWDLQQQYLAESGLIKGIKSFLVRALLHYVRSWDVSSSNRVNLFLANSNYVGRRIQKVYRRDSLCVYPPVDVEKFATQVKKEDFYFTMSRLVSYKRIDLIIDAFNETPSRRLIVIGDGPEYAKLKAKAGPNITMLGFQPFEHVREYMQRAKAFVFAAEEDFGIVPVEAQACGTPVIAFARGGVTESVIDGRTGVFFKHQTVESLKAAVDEFEANDVGWNPLTIRENAERFSNERFKKSFEKVVEDAWLDFVGGKVEFSSHGAPLLPAHLHAAVKAAHQVTATSVGLEGGFGDLPIPNQPYGTEPNTREASSN